MPLLKKAPTQTLPTAIPLVEKAIDSAVATQMIPASAKKLGGVHKAGDRAAAKSETMTRADWDNKDRRISRQGLFQACLQSVGLLQLNTGNTLEDYLKLIEQAADRGFEYVNRQ
jgi:hypothetical protein